MNNIQRNPNERGSAILLVLGFLSLLLMMAMIFATTGRNAQIIADAKADETNAQLQARSAVTQGQEAVFFLQNKGNILGSSDADLQDCLPGNADIEQSPTKLNSSANYTLDKKGKELYYGTTGSVDEKLLGVQPYVGFTTNELPTSWRFLAFYGELASDAFSTTPYGISTDNPYQSIYYSHAADVAAADFDEVAKQGENSLYEIVKGTTLGNLYWRATGSAGGQFEQLLKDNVATQLQFRNFFQEDPEDNTVEHVFSRQGFIMFNEGSKFDVNRLVSSAMEGDANEPYVPYIGGDGTDANVLGALTLGEPGTGLNIDVKPGRSTYAIMGRNYAANEYTSNQIYTSIDEDLTLQYGLHPAELQTRIEGGETLYEKGLTRKKDDMPSRWFSYEHLLSDTDVASVLEDDIFTLGVESGVDDRELRFNGQYANMPELLASIGDIEDTNGDGINDSLIMTSDGKIDTLNSDCSYLAKTNVAYPWGLYCETTAHKPNATCPTFGCANPSWDKIGEKLATVWTDANLKTMAQHFFKEHLGLNYTASNPLFKDDSGADKTLDVFANLTDFCDSDYAVTYTTSTATGRVDFNGTSYAQQPTPTALTSLGAKNLKAPTYCGNERVPAIVGVNVTLEPSSNTNISLSVQNPTYSNSLDGNLPSLVVSTGKFALKPVITVNLQNLLNEKIAYDQNYRVIVYGQIAPMIRAKVVQKNKSTGTTTIQRPTGRYEIKLVEEQRWSNLLKRYITIWVPKKVEIIETVVVTGDIYVPQYKNAVLVKNNALSNNDYQVVSLGSFADDYGADDYGYSSSSGEFTNTTLKAAVQSNCRRFVIDAKGTAASHTFDPLEASSFEITADDMLFLPNPAVPTGAFSQLVKSGYYYTGTGYAVQIQKIIVVAENDSTHEVCDVAFLKERGITDDASWHVIMNSTGSEGVPTTSMNFNNPIQNGAIADGGYCNTDPRLNHLETSWTWLGKNDCTVEIGGGYYAGCIPASTVTGSDKDARNDWTQATLITEKVWPAMKSALLYTSKATTEQDWEPAFDPMGTGYVAPSSSNNYVGKMANTISTAFIPNSPIASLWQLGAVFRGEKGRSLNLKSFGTNSSGTITHAYADGDAWILDYVKLNELNPNNGIRGKFNPNCFNMGAYRYLFANIPANPDANDTMIYANGFYDPESTDVKRNTYFADFIDATRTGGEDLEDDVFRFKEVGTGTDYPQVSKADGILAAQSWSPVQAFFNFVEVDGGTSSRRSSASSVYKCNDRQAESLIGCTAGLLSTRYEVFTLIAVGQSVKYIMSAAEMDAIGAAGSAERNAFMKQLANPIEIDFMRGSNHFYEWYSILSTQVREVTFVRDCWFGRIKILKSRLL